MEANMEAADYDDVMNDSEEDGAPVEGELFNLHAANPPPPPPPICNGGEG